jgi:hypothetical protein
MNKCLGIQYPFPISDDLAKYSSGISKFQLIETQSRKKHPEKKLRFIAIRQFLGVHWYCPGAF